MEHLNGFLIMKIKEKQNLNNFCQIWAILVKESPCKDSSLVYIFCGVIVPQKLFHEDLIDVCASIRCKHCVAFTVINPWVLCCRETEDRKLFCNASKRNKEPDWITSYSDKRKEREQLETVKVNFLRYAAC